MIDHLRKLLFIHISRTGGTSVETALVGSDWWHIDPESKHLSASQTRTFYGDACWAKYRKFSIVRNPWDRITSMWSTGWWNKRRTSFLGGRPASFRDFIRELRPHPHERYRTLSYGKILDEPLDYVLRFESLQEDFSAMCRDLRLDEVQLPHVEHRKRLPYRAYYDEESAQLVRDLFAADIKAYGYRF
jgi:hypothetical protein